MHRKTDSFEKAEIHFDQVAVGLVHAYMIVDMKRMVWMAKHHRPTEDETQALLEQAAEYMAKVLERNGITVTKETIQ